MKSWTQTLRKPVAALAAVFLLVGSALTGAAAETGEAPAPSASTLDWNQFLGNEEAEGRIRCQNSTDGRGIQKGLDQHAAQGKHHV